MNETELQSWVTAQRARVEYYLRGHSLPYSQVAEWPAFEVAPHFGIWAVESATEPNAIGWWVFCGDIPTDYIAGRGIPDPRAALGALVRAWNGYIPFLERGEQPPNTRLGPGFQLPELAELLRLRVTLLDEWYRDEEVWADLGL